MTDYRLCWPEGVDMGGSMLLLVAVEPQAAQENGAIPCRVVGQLTPGSPFAPREAETPAARVTALLSGVGVPANLRGYAYLRSALLLALGQPEVLRGLNRRLYPQVAQEHGASAPAVERAIRHAIAAAWARGGGERCRALLGRACSCVGDCPSNGEMLTMLSDHLRLHPGG